MEPTPSIEHEVSFPGLEVLDGLVAVRALHEITRQVAAVQ